MKALASVLVIAVVAAPSFCQKSKKTGYKVTGGDPVSATASLVPSASSTPTPSPAPTASTVSASATSSATAPIDAVSPQPAATAKEIVGTPADAVPARFGPGAKLFIEPMNGFESYLEGAILKKKVPVTIVDDRSKADFVVSGLSDEAKAGWAKVIFISPKSHAQASITVKDAHTGNLVFAYNVDKSNAVRANQSTAEACAKHLKEALGKK